MATFTQAARPGPGGCRVAGWVSGTDQWLLRGWSDKNPVLLFLAGGVLVSIGVFLGLGGSTAWALFLVVGSLPVSANPKSRN